MAQEFNIGAMKAEAMRKAFGIDMEKGRTGVYEDNAENRRLNRVGQHYGHKKEEEASTGKQPGKSAQPTGQEQKTSAATMESAAQGASDEALKRALADKKAPEDVKAAAKKELANRGGGEEEKPSAESAIKNAESLIKDYDRMISEIEKTLKEEKDPELARFLKEQIDFIKENQEKLKGKIEGWKKEQQQKAATSKFLNEAISGDGLTYQQISDLLDNDAETREAVYTYFNYEREWAEEEGATEEQLKFCDKLKKLGAKIAPKTFDGHEAEEAEEYREKMEQKGYEMFDIYDGDTYIWLAVKSSNLKQQ